MEALIELLKNCKILLESVGEYFWSTKIKAILVKFNKNDPYLLGEILSWYGGMSSFNDLIFSKTNNHLICDDNEENLNRELNKFRTEIYNLTVQLARELD
jgi:hypothetical protein